MKVRMKVTGIFNGLGKVRNVFWKTLILTGLLGLPLAGYPFSLFDNPLPSSQEGLKVREHILGSWASSSTYHFIIQDSHIHIYPHASGRVDLFFIATSSPDSGYGCKQYHGYTAKTKDMTVLCLWEIQTVSDSQEGNIKKKSPKCMLFPYKVTDDGMLHIWAFDWGKLMECVEDGKLKGEITRTPVKTRDGDTVERKDMQIQASPEELERFFSTSGLEELIGKKPEMSFYRLSKPERKPFTPPEKP